MKPLEKTREIVNKRNILECIDDAESFPVAASLEQFLADRKTLNAVTRSIEVMGDAAKRIPKTLTEK